MKISIARLLLASTVSLSMSGCVSMFPAASAELEPGKYRILTTGSVLAKTERLQAKIDKKALKLCGEGYTYKTPAGLFEIVTTPTYINGSMTNINAQKLTRVVYCKDYVGADKVE